MSVLSFNDFLQINWISCSKCSLQFPTEKSVLAHQSRAHSSTSENCTKRRKMNNCQLCPLKYQKRFGLIRHMRSCHKEHVYEFWVSCHLCQLAYPDSKTLQAHLVRSHNGTSAETTLELINGSDLKQVSKEQNRQAVKSGKIVPKKSSGYCCKLCFHKSQMFVNYLKHMRSKHSKHVEEFWIACTQCQVFYPNKTSLQKHVLRTHSLMPSPLKTSESKNPGDNDAVK